MVGNITFLMICAVFDMSPLTQWINCSFYRAMLCMCSTSHGPVSVSVTSRCSTKMAKRRITQRTPHDSPANLVFWRQRSPRNFTRATRMGTPNAVGVGHHGGCRRLGDQNKHMCQEVTGIRELFEAWLLSTKWKWYPHKRWHCRWKLSQELKKGK